MDWVDVLFEVDRMRPSSPLARSRALGLTLALVLSACAAPPAITKAPALEEGSLTAKPKARSQVAGTLVAPVGILAAKLVGADGASLVGADGAGLIGADGAGLVGADGAGFTRHLLALNQSPLANASCYLSDPSGKPLKGYSGGTTNAKGEFSIARAPQGKTCVVAASIKTAAGKESRLQTLARIGSDPVNAKIELGSTLLSQALLDGLKGEPANFDAKAYDRAITLVGATLKLDALPDYGTSGACRTYIDGAAAGNSELGGLVSSLRDALAGVVATPPPAPSQAPKPTPTPTPVATTTPPPLAVVSPTPEPSPTVAPPAVMTYKGKVKIMSGGGGSLESLPLTFEGIDGLNVADANSVVQFTVSYTKLPMSFVVKILNSPVGTLTLASTAGGVFAEFKSSDPNTRFGPVEAQ